MIAQIDENMGKLEAFLTQSGLRENTLVVFLTDNGGTAGVKFYNAGLREGKTTFYEGGHRVPCWIRWPAGKLGDPRDIDTPAQVQDLLPTLCDLTASPLPSSNQFDGRSLARLLRDRQPLEHRKFVVQYSRAKLTKWECCVIDGPWRLVHGNELYHVERDLGQKQNLAADEPDKVAELRQHYEQWWRELESDAATFVRIAIGAPQEPLVELTSADWQDVYCDNANHIREAVGGARARWLELERLQAGKYRVTLRRWPKELDLPFQSSAPAAASGNARAVMGKALRFTRLRFVSMITWSNYQSRLRRSP